MATRLKGIAKSGESKKITPDAKIHQHNADRPAEEPTDNFPAPMADEAFRRLAGQVTSILKEQNETCREALLSQFLVGFGNLIGKGPHTEDQHYLNEFVCVVGPTATARKGTSLRSVIDHLLCLDPDWKGCERSGISTAEGLIYSLRDARVVKNKPDPGIADKRALLRVEEFSQIMAKIIKGGTLSQRLRECWDHRSPLENRTKMEPISATGTHISMIAHCTPDELEKTLRTTEVRNGFGNRFLWVAAKSVRSVSRPKPIDWTAHADIVNELRNIVERFQRSTKIGFTTRGRTTWDNWYNDYYEQRQTFRGSFAELAGRCEAHVKRLAAIYAVLDDRENIDEAHLNSAWAFWRYCADSIRWAFPARMEKLSVPPGQSPIATNRANKSPGRASQASGRNDKDRNKQNRFLF